MKRTIRHIWLLLPLLFTPTAFALDNEYPGRDEFPDVLVYEKAQLFNDLSDVILVDTRSKHEYQTLHIKGAVNIPLSTKDFGLKIIELRATSNKPIVFYCTSRTCYKSYRAGREANYLNIEDTYAYDAGVFEWAKSYPKHVTLLDMIPAEPADILSATTPQNVHISFAGP